MATHLLDALLIRRLRRQFLLFVGRVSRDIGANLHLPCLLIQGIGIARRRGLERNLCDGLFHRCRFDSGGLRRGFYWVWGRLPLSTSLPPNTPTHPIYL